MLKQKDSEKTQLIIPIKRNVDQNEDQVKEIKTYAFSVIWMDQNHYMILYIQILYEMATDMGDRDLLRKFSGRDRTSIDCQSIEMLIRYLEGTSKLTSFENRAKARVN